MRPFVRSRKCHAMTPPLSTVPPTGFLLAFLVVVGFVAGFGASLISFAVATRTGHGTVFVRSNDETDREELRIRLEDDRFFAHAIVGTALGGIFAAVFAIGQAADIGVVLPLITATLAVGVGWILTRKAYVRRRIRSGQPRTTPPNGSEALTDVAVYVVSLLVLLPVLYFLSFLFLV